MSEDEVIVKEVRSALERDAHVSHPDAIAVSATHGAVLLRGTVSSLRQRRAAIVAANEVAGVGTVSEGLTVEPRVRWDDAELRGAALQALMDDAAVPSDRVDVKVADRWLTLKGEVRRQDESDAAFVAVSPFSRRSGLTNEIKVITAGIDG